MKDARDRGSVMITLIVAMLLVCVLGAGICSLTRSSLLTGLLSNNDDQAYQLAQAGIRYKIKNLSDPNVIGEFFFPDSGHKFNISYDDVTKTITSVGIVNEGAFTEARRVITYDVTSYWKKPDTNPDGTITNPPETKPIVDGSNPSGAIVVDPNGNIILGGSVTDSSGSLWYQGSSSAGNCNAGECAFNYGLRTYFDFTAGEDSSDLSTSRGDGFTFTVMSAINNTRDRTGGAPSGISIGELLGFAGPGNTASMAVGPNEGLRPPKMAVEFDTYPNGTASICGSDSRNDNNAGSQDFRNHMAVLFWGENVPSGSACSGIPRNSYDDNRHESGSGDDSSTTGAGPVNSYNGYAGGGYYEGTKSRSASGCQSSWYSTCNWMEDGHGYSVRLEIIRYAIGTGGFYRIKGWIYRDTQPPSDLTAYRNLQVPYAATPPQIDRTVLLTTTYHNALNKIFFGFTEATGGAAQNIVISNFKVFFPQTATCLAMIIPKSRTAPPYGATGQSVAVSTGDDCSWTAAPNGAWISITGAAAGTGPGTVSYNVEGNYTGATREGLITIADQIFTVTQPSCLYTVGTATPLYFNSSGGNGTSSVTATSGCPWSTSNNGNDWITVIPASSTGTGASQSVTYTVAANTGAARNGTMTIAGRNFTVNQAAYPCPSLSITTPTPPAGRQGQPYSLTMSANGGSGTLTYLLYSGTLPPGLNLDANTGVISGTPTSAGIWNNIRVRVTDTCYSGAQTAQTGNFSIRIQYNPYRVYAGTDMYYRSGSCYSLDRDDYVNLSYDNAITFYRYNYNGCWGSSYTVTYSNAAAADDDNDGRVEVNRNGNSWGLDDR